MIPSCSRNDFQSCYRKWINTTSILTNQNGEFSVYLSDESVNDFVGKKKKKLYEKGRDLHTLICRNFQTLNVSKRMLLFFYLFFNCFYLNQAIGRHVRFCLRSTTNLSIQAFFFHYRSYSQSYTTCALHSGNLSNCLFGGLFFSTFILESSLCLLDLEIKPGLL